MTPILFQWEASGNPNDPGGIATFKCNGMTLSIALNDFSTGSRLSNLLEAAYQLGRNDAIDKALRTVPRLLKDQRYG